MKIKMSDDLKYIKIPIFLVYLVFFLLFVLNFYFLTDFKGVTEHVEGIEVFIITISTFFITTVEFILLLFCLKLIDYLKENVKFVRTEDQKKKGKK